MTRSEEAKKLTADAKEIFITIGRSWTAYASICDRMVKEKLYSEVGFETFGDWCKAVGDKSASQSYDMARIHSELKEDIPEATIANLTIDNARDLVKVPKKKRTAKVVEMASSLPNNQFREELNKVADVKLEPRTNKSFHLDRSTSELVTEALALAKKEEGVTSDSEALEVVCQAYMATEDQDTHYKAAKALIDAIEEQVNEEKTSAPPDKKGWASILVTSRRLARILGIHERRVMPSRSQTSQGVSTRVQ